MNRLQWDIEFLELQMKNKKKKNTLKRNTGNAEISWKQSLKSGYSERQPISPPYRKSIFLISVEINYHKKRGGQDDMLWPHPSICFYDRNNLSWVFFFKGRCFKIFLSNICLTSLIYHCNLWWHRIPENKQRIEKN